MRGTGFGVFGAEQVCASGGAVQHGPTGEYPDRCAVGVVQCVADVVVGVAGCVDDAELDGAGVYDVAVAERRGVGSRRRRRRATMYSAPVVRANSSPPVT